MKTEAQRTQGYFRYLWNYTSLNSYLVYIILMFICNFPPLFLYCILSVTLITWKGLPKMNEWCLGFWINSPEHFLIITKVKY